jgi:[protein-PII] uridylyltransferase
MDGTRSKRDAAGASRDRRAIIDLGRLQADLAALVAADLPEAERRTRQIATLGAAMEKGDAVIRRRFETALMGTQAVRERCYLVDQILRAVYDLANRHLYPLGSASAGERLALVAVGGYGRGELAPFSDIDLLFLLPYKVTPRSEQVTESMLYLLWDLGFKVGHAVRSVDDCLRQAKADMTIRTNLLEKRFLCGDRALFQELQQRYRKTLQGGSGIDFIEAKLAERDRRHERLGGSRYLLEPNIKDGKGGLRDLHTLFWIAKYIYRVNDIAQLVPRGVFTRREVRRFEKAQNYLWTLRCFLHYLTGRAEERLTFDLQQAIAPHMGYKAHAGTQDVERLMKHYFLIAKDVGTLTGIFCAALEAERRRPAALGLAALAPRRRIDGFPLERNRLTVEGAEVFETNPIEMLRIFQVAQAHELDIHPRALHWITRNLRRIDRELRRDPAANAIFMDILTSDKNPETALRRMNEAGVFGRFMPDFGRVVAQMQYNMYHHYTVDEHTIFAIGILHAIETGKLVEEAPIATEVVHKVLSRRVLYLAVLFHDIAKGRPGDHSQIGAEIAQKLCPRLGLSEEETETVAWLVLHHLAMSNTAFRRDVDDPQTIRDFTDLVQSSERLRLLLVLTVADIRAVGPNTWTSWKAVLLRELYWRSEEVLSGGLAAIASEQRVERAKALLSEALDDWPRLELEDYLARGDADYWLTFDPEAHIRHASLVRQAERAGRDLVVDTRIDRYREVTEVTVYTPDQPGLFSKIAGALAVSGATIDAAKICTLTNGMALDVFYVRDVTGGLLARADKLARLSARIEQAIAGRLNIMQELARRASPIPTRYSVFQVQPRVLIDNGASATHTVIEVNGRDRPALLYRLTQALTELDITIGTAKISTYGERVVDVFYLHNAAGTKIEDSDQLERIRRRLLAVLADMPGTAKAGAGAAARREPAAPAPSPAASPARSKSSSPADSPAE